MRPAHIYSILTVGALLLNPISPPACLAEEEVIERTSEEAVKPLLANLLDCEQREGMRKLTDEENREINRLIQEEECNPATKVQERWTFFTDHSHSMHHVMAITRKGTVAELEDGSIWIIHPDDNLATYNWLTTDTIVITPAIGNSIYRFQMINLNTGGIIYVRLAIAPLPGTIYTHWAYIVDHAFREVCLEDGSWWKISSADIGFFYDWRTDDYVIIGNTIGSDASYDNNILINVRLNEYVRATRI